MNSAKYRMDSDLLFALFYESQQEKRVEVKSAEIHFTFIGRKVKINSVYEFLVLINHADKTLIYLPFK